VLALMFKIISKYSKTGNLKYISHLDVLRFIQRAVKRANIPACYSEGFNPHMKTSFGFPLSLGNESIGEYFDLETKEKIDLNDFVENLNKVMPKEMQILKAAYKEDDESIMAKCAFVSYLINIEFENINLDELNNYLEEMRETGAIFNREKKNKKNKMVIKEINTKDYINYLKLNKTNENKATIEAVFVTTQTGSMKTDEFIKLIERKGFELSYYSIMKVDSFDKNMKPIL
jgi:radical SAM-linked protein